VIRLLADENFNNNIVRGVRLQDPDIDSLRRAGASLAQVFRPMMVKALCLMSGAHDLEGGRCYRQLSWHWG